MDAKALCGGRRLSESVRVIAKTEWTDDEERCRESVCVRESARARRAHSSSERRGEDDRGNEAGVGKKSTRTTVSS